MNLSAQFYSFIKYFCLQYVYLFKILFYIHFSTLFIHILGKIHRNYDSFLKYLMTYLYYKKLHIFIYIL